MNVLTVFAYLTFVIYASAAPSLSKWVELTKSSTKLVDDPALVFTSEVRSDMFGFLDSDLLRTISHAWSIFKDSFKRKYKSVLEEGERFFIFAQNFVQIMKHNREYHEGKHSYELGINKLSDKSQSELAQLRGFRMPRGRSLKSGSTFLHFQGMALPSHVDWRKEGAVTGVKDQGSCGSCWAFSATGAIEGHHYRKSKKLISMSEQQLVDCSDDYGNAGCNGGLMDNAFKYVRDNQGIDDECSYPYVSGETGEPSTSCKFNKTTVVANVTGFVNVMSGSEEQLAEAVATRGPVSVAINAGRPGFAQYKSGIYSDPECGGEPQDLDHGVLLVGYGEEAGVAYWLVKNSWGTSWGETGYIKMRRNAHNMCGIATASSYPLV